MAIETSKSLIIDAIIEMVTWKIAEMEGPVESDV